MVRYALYVFHVQTYVSVALRWKALDPNSVRSIDVKTTKVEEENAGPHSTFYSTLRVLNFTRAQLL